MACLFVLINLFLSWKQQEHHSLHFCFSKIDLWFFFFFTASSFKVSWRDLAIKCSTFYWKYKGQVLGCSSMVPPPALQARGPEFDPCYKRKKKERNNKGQFINLCKLLSLTAISYPSPKKYVSRKLSDSIRTILFLFFPQLHYLYVIFKLYHSKSPSQHKHCWILLWWHQAAMPWGLVWIACCRLQSHLEVVIRVPDKIQRHYTKV